MNEAKASSSKDDNAAGIKLDSIYHTYLSKRIGWLSPASFLLAFLDWHIHLAMSPDKLSELLNSSLQRYQKSIAFRIKCLTEERCKNVSGSDDSRFQNELWEQFPFNLLAENFLLWEQQWNEATQNLRGSSKHHEDVVNFTSRQLLDILSPSNYILTNPEILSATLKSGGSNLLKGAQNFIQDVTKVINQEPAVGTENFKVGVNLAITQGKVVYKNRLIELIQYEPTTKEVCKEPILLIPAWIMKYYILDLSPHNSMVKYLINEGHTVFIISWKNPTSEDRDLGLEEYVNFGVMDAIKTINQIIPNTKINAVGYCIGGTLLMIAAAYMAKMNDDRLKSITLFAAQIDFKDAGELMLFIDDSQVTYLEDLMSEKGYLDGSQMAGTFSMLNSIQLIWSRIIREYLLGEREPLFDLMAWDYDTTRLPCRMHSEYLRKLFLNNDLVEGKFSVNGEKILLLDINVPIFAVSTTKDHVAPWKSVYKVHFFTHSDITFVLTSGGHNAGIVSEPGHPHRTYQIKASPKGIDRLNLEKWQSTAETVEGSWWVDWHKWLSEHSDGLVPPPKIGNPAVGITALCDAPGTYVLQK